MAVIKENIKKILVIRNDRFGEFLLNIPVIVALRRVFGSARIVLVVGLQVEELAKRIPLVDEVLTWDNFHSHTFLERLFFLSKIKRRKFDMAIILNPSKEFNIISYLARIPVRLGYNRKWGFLLNHKIEDKKSEGLKHEVDYNLELIKTIGIDYNASDIRFPLEIEDEDFSASKMENLGIDRNNFILMHPWASNRDKEWPLEKFRELALKLYSDFGFKTAVVGGCEEMERAKIFCSDSMIINLTAKTSLIELAGLLKKGRLLISNDSGPMHLAAILGMPTVAIFRKRPFSVSARRWGPVGKNHIIIENDIINNIEVNEVRYAARKILQS